MTQTQTTSPSLVIRRTFAAPRARVFAAWTDIALLPQWLGPAGFTSRKVEADVRVGGTYRFTMISPEGEELTMKGAYTAIRPPEHLAYTFRWEEDVAADETETNVSIDFLDRGTQTEIVFMQTGLKSDESARQHTEGWNSVFDKFATVVPAGETS